MAKPTQAELKELFDYLPDAGILVRKKCTANRHTKGEVVGFLGGRGYLQAAVRSVKYPLHNLIWVWVYGAWPTGDIDHINRDRADNRIVNLRSVSRSENNHNSSMSRRNTSGATGVCWDRTRQLWLASICVHGRQKHLGRFATVAEANEAYRQAKTIHHPTAPHHV